MPTGQASASPAKRPIAAPASREEAEDLVHQLAALSTHAAPPKAAPHKPAVTGKVGPPQAGGTGKAVPPEALAGDDEAAGENGAAHSKSESGPSPSGRSSEEEPINRGMLLKFLSSVRP